MSWEKEYTAERQLALVEAKFEVLKSKLENIEKGALKSGDFNIVIDKDLLILKDKVSKLESGISEIKRNIEELNSNVFLQFTKDIDLKKFITIILILSTAVTSPTVINSWLNLEPQSNLESEKLEKLINLLEQNTEN